MNRQEEAQFERVLFDAIDEAKKLGYRPNKFIGMITNQGAFRTVKDIVASNRPSDGFERLLLLRRPDLTCESIIVETQWRKYFDDDLLQIAERRLTQYEHKWHRYAASDLTEPDSPAPESTPVPNSNARTDEAQFIPPNDDHRERVLRLAYHRPGQPLFREMLINAYGAHCCVTGTAVPEALEAAHICAYRGDRSNHVANGLLLRADLHSLFDRFMFSVEPTSLEVRLSRKLKKNDTYKVLEGAKLTFNGKQRPSRAALELHWKEFTLEP